MIVINKAGGLVYQREFNPGLQNVNTNDYLVLAGTFHGCVLLLSNLGPDTICRSDFYSVHAITKSLTPRLPSSTGGTTVPNPGVASSGIESMETQFFRLSCFQTLTGMKFLLFTDPLTPNTDFLMKGVYERYADFVMKNPFYQLEMPIRVEAWDRTLNSWLKTR